jgi:multicomponent Na+:H+ antiporter subunit A
MLWLIIIPLLSAGLTPLVYRAFAHRAAWLLAAVPIGLAAAVVAMWPEGPDASVIQTTPWIPALDIDLAFRLDGLSGTFALLVCGIGSLVLLYAGSYLRDDPRLGRLVGQLLLFLSAMLGVVLSDDLYVLFVFWELTSIASYLLIGFKHEKQAARDSARQALLITGAGGLAMLAGFILLHISALQSGIAAAEASRISVLASADLTGHALFTPALVLVIIGACSKSAQMPLHFWLPNAMTAPTPVSSYLHSATMVKAGIFLLARLNPVFGDSMVWHVMLTTIGAMTMVIAAAMAAGQSDLKRILAYTTVSVLGTLTMLIGVGTDLAIKAAVVYLTAHACYKAALFMIAGSLEHATGTRDVRELGGLARTMPWTMASGLIAALSMAGAPPLFGFIGKELLLKAKLDLESLGVVLILVASIANIFLIAMALVVAVWPFFGRSKPHAEHAHEAPWTMRIGPLLLAAVGLLIGLVPGAFDRVLGTAMATAIGGRPIPMELKLWYGVSPVALTALSISAVTLTAGFFLFLKLRHLLAPIGTTVSRLGRVGPARGYDLALAALLAVAGFVTRHTQTGSLRQYVRLALLTLVIIAVFPLGRSLRLDALPAGSWDWHVLVLLALTLVGAGGAIVLRPYVSAIALLGITGLLIATLFALLSAPDLAITQIMVEALTVILLVLVFRRLPAAVPAMPSERLFDAVVALAAGGIMTAFVLASTTLDLPADVSAQLAAMSKPEAYGRNVVNVILVDFRAMDTLGEIAVVTTAAFGVLALLTRSRHSDSSTEDAS